MLRPNMFWPSHDLVASAITLLALISTSTTSSGESGDVQNGRCPSLMFWSTTFNDSFFPDELPARSWVMAMLCSSCSGFAQWASLPTPADFEAWSSRPPRDYQTFRSVIEYRLPKASELRSSATRCDLCRIIFRNCREHRSRSRLISQRLLDKADAPVEIVVCGGYGLLEELKIHSCIIRVRDVETFGMRCWLYTDSKNTDGRSGQVFANPPPPPRMRGFVGMDSRASAKLCLQSRELQKKALQAYHLNPNRLFPGGS
ncbi:hypothetical protein BO71DRAFT_242210 [Aspergillus ellipticus CBS 707.79]|uniref:Uncharacterized protein n=1 Tax=Aspergillus ellipticus CBS 707.79 TaxID=1448320 RepID=A0A319D9N9_9EURO|nr:hypothetical protein BO71DRAFT_242210 [Aspergillus ellipticus CBS 707.79]